ncbi:MAG TPA: ABC transporter substrate-binding protein [Stellaceae bacterium]|nr:ABC transporter substrate-binding protein [Stellaceae bacterium]
MRKSYGLRRLAALGLATGFLVALGAGPSLATDKLRVGKAIAGPIDFTPLDIGIAKGFYQKHGLDIEEVNFAGSAKLQQGLGADAVDIGLGSGPELVFVAKGNSDLGVAAFAGPPSGLVMVVREGLPINKPADLKGRKISVSTVGGLTDWMVHEASRYLGWGPEGIQAVPLGTNAAQIAAMETGQIDGMMIDVAGAATLAEQHKSRIILRCGTFVPEFINHVTFATNKMIAQHPEQIRAFLAGWFETVAWMRKNKEESVKLAAPVMHQPLAIAASAYDEVMPSLSDTGKFEPKGLAVLARSFVETRQLPTEPDMSKLYTEKFLPGAM